MAATGIRLRRKPSKGSFAGSEAPLIGELIMATDTTEFGWLDENATMVWGRLENELPIGGLTGNVLVKSTDNDYEVEWGTASGGGGGGNFSGTEDPNIQEAIEPFGSIGDSYTQLPKPDEVDEATYSVTTFDGSSVSGAIYASVDEEFRDIFGIPFGGTISGPVTTFYASADSSVFYVKFGNTPQHNTTLLVNDEAFVTNAERWIELGGGVFAYMFPATDSGEITRIPNYDTIIADLISPSYNYTTSDVTKFPYQEWYKKDETTWVKKPTTQRIVASIPTDEDTIDDEIGTIYFVI